MKKGGSLYQERYLVGFGLKMGEAHDDRVAHTLAELTFLWGRIEYVFYLILESIDEKRAGEWIDTYFKSRSLGLRIKAAKKKIIDATSVAYPEFKSMLETVLVQFEPVRDRRNALVHGVWRRAGSKTFVVFPMRKEPSGVLESEIEVTYGDIVRLVDGADRILNEFATLGTEMKVFQWVEANKRRMRAARERVTAQKMAGQEPDGVVPDVD